MPERRRGAASPGAIARSVRGWRRSARPGARRSRPGSTRRSPRSARVDARLLIVGLAPGLQGANRTGRPFTGDYAGVLLYETLRAIGFARGTYGAHPDDGLELIDCRITNAVRCVPPENKPTPAEIATCRDFLIPTIAEMKNLRAIVALGRVAHDSVVTALRRQEIGDAVQAWRQEHRLGALALFSSYHCSRYNTNTGVLTPEMFRRGFPNGARPAPALKIKSNNRSRRWPRLPASPARNFKFRLSTIFLFKPPPPDSEVPNARFPRIGIPIRTPLPIQGGLK